MADVQALAAEIKALAPHERLRMAADLMVEAGKQTRAQALTTLGVAHSIAHQVSVELGALLALEQIGGRRG